MQAWRADAAQQTADFAPSRLAAASGSGRGGSAAAETGASQGAGPGGAGTSFAAGQGGVRGRLQGGLAGVQNPRQRCPRWRCRRRRSFRSACRARRRRCSGSQLWAALYKRACRAARQAHLPGMM